MAALLVLGSKPAPRIPPAKAYAALACANASGRSARLLGLADPAFTVMSSVLASSKNAANHLARKALAGLDTETLYYCPRPLYRRDLLKRLLHMREVLACRPKPFARKIRAAGFSFQTFVVWPLRRYIRLVEALCGEDAEVQRELEVKQPSTGVLAAVIGLGEVGYERVILSGFSFEITHAYVDNPLIARRGTEASRHADIDIAVLRAISARTGRLMTTEPIVHERTGVPLLGI